MKLKDLIAVSVLKESRAPLPSDYMEMGRKGIELGRRVETSCH